MLVRNPKEFDRVAREWAVKYAGAPKKSVGEGSGGTTTEMIREKEKRSKEEEERERLAAYVTPSLFRFELVLT
jgi:ubiquitin-conjugating enzyme (huntingtin interacting protein 2)